MCETYSLIYSINTRANLPLIPRKQNFIYNFIQLTRIQFREETNIREFSAHQCESRTVNMCGICTFNWLCAENSDTVLQVAVRKTKPEIRGFTCVMVLMALTGCNGQALDPSALSAETLGGDEQSEGAAEADDAFTGSGVAIEFKQFGVSLAFTPTVIGGDLINLVVAPEVSRLDPLTSVVVDNLEIPGLITRRAKTTVELRDGQSFAIAGLLQNDFSDNIRAFPFLGDLPIIGALFRSTQYQKGETELVIVVTPHLVNPAAGPEHLALPTDNFVPPDEFSLFMMGRTEGWTSGKPQPKPETGAGPIVSSTPQPQSQVGGLDGSYGHIIQ